LCMKQGWERTPRPRETPVITQEDIVMVYKTYKDWDGLIGWSWELMNQEERQ
jgi:hypothetical protein